MPDALDVGRDLMLLLSQNGQLVPVDELIDQVGAAHVRLARMVPGGVVGPVGPGEAADPPRSPAAITTARRPLPAPCGRRPLRIAAA